jgi:hypothetical protein
MWSKSLHTRGWSERAIAQLPLCLAPSTLAAYNGAIKKLKDFCDKSGADFPPHETSVIADFFCHIADMSASPRSQLKIAFAAIGHMYSDGSLRNVLDRHHLSMLETALIKSATTQPMTRSQIMPIQAFRDLFEAWPINSELTIRRLRLKCITLMALVLMLRPSDIAPKAVHFSPDSLNTHRMVFSTDNVKFLASGEAKIVFHGVKNDTSRTDKNCVL